MTYSYIGNQTKSLEKQIQADANSAHIKANSAFDFSNSVNVFTQSAYNHTNSAFIHANSAYVSQNTTGVYANAAYDHANTKFATAGGTISGNVVITEKLTVGGQVNLHTPIINLNPDIDELSNPTDNAGLNVSRGFQPNVSILWDETSDFWIFTNDGTNYSKIASNAAESYSNSAFIHANSAYVSQNTTGVYANTAYEHANSAYVSQNTTGVYANTAYEHANASYTLANSFSTDAQIAGSYANSAFIHANSSYIHVNSAFEFANTVDVKAFTSGRYANSAFAQANSSDERAISAGVYGNAAFTLSNIVSSYANSAFNLANTKFASDGGTIGGDVVVTGNLKVSGSVTYIESNQLNIGDNIITLNADIDQLSNPTENAGILVDRGFDSNSVLLWNELNDSWQFTNDGTNYSNIGSAAAESYSNSAFIHANSAYVSQNTTGVYANTAYEHANSAYVSQNTTGVYANTAYEHANSAYISQNTTGVYANAAYAHANTKFATAGGTISGDVSITGNLTVTGTETKLRVTNLEIQDNIIELNSEVAGSPTANVGIRVNRGDEVPVQFRWNETKGNWEFTKDGLTYSNVASSSAESYANSAFETANNALVAGGQIAGGYANSAFQAANNASSYSNSAYLHANASFELANSFSTEAATAGGYANSAFIHANSAYVSQNTTGVYANAAYDQANTANQQSLTSGAYANSAFETANNALVAGGQIAGGYANSAFQAANIADQRAITSGDYANSAYGTANNADQRAVTSGAYANAAYGQANISNQIALTSGDYANSAYSLSNVTSNYVQAAFDQANSTISLGLNVEHESFVGDGTTTSFIFSIAEPESKNYTIVTIEGITQLKESYEIVGNSLVFYEPPASSNRIDFTVLQSQPNQLWRDSRINAAFQQSNTANTNIVSSYNHANAAFNLANTISFGGSFEVSVIVDNFVGDNSTSTFTLSTTPVNQNYVIVSIEGIFQLRSSYSLNNQFITFNQPPSLNNRIEVTSFTSAQLSVEYSAANLANNAVNVANFAANTANSAAANTAQIPFAYRHANSSYIHANSAHIVSNSASSYANGAFAKSNTANTLAQAAYDAANNAVDTWVRIAANSASSYANGAFAKSNTANTLAQAAYDAANNATDSWVRDAANSASSYANGAFAKSNTANTLAQAAYDAANNAVDTWVRIAANSASSYANGAFSSSNTKLSLTGGTISGDLIITGNLNVTGNTISHSANDLIVNDPLILLANNNAGNTLDLGFVAHYVEDSNVKHTGLIRDVSDDIWYLFDNYLPHIQETNILDVSNTSFRIANLAANLITDVLVVKGFDVLNYTNSSYNQANASFNNSNTAIINALSASNYANAAFNAANNAVDTWVRDAANSASSYANGAYGQANTANTLAQAAYDAANNAVDTWVRDAANSASSYANGAYGAANTANTLAQAAYDAANNAVDTWVRDAANSASSYSNSAYGAANTANTLAQAAYDAANNATDSWVRDAANSASSYSNSAYGAANTADQRSLTTGFYANGAFSRANSANLLAQQSYDSTNLNTQLITTVGLYANAAFSESNAAFSIANSANIKTGIVGSYANGAFKRANDAYDLVSALSSNGDFVLSVVLDNFIGDGVTTTFELSALPANKNYTSITIEGITQLKDSYELSGSNVVFSSPPENNDRIDVTIFSSQETDFTSASSYSNSAFLIANSSYRHANSSYIHANAAFEDSNTRLSASGGIVSGDLSITGNLLVLGNTTSYSVEEYIINDPIILLANNNPSNNIDIGFVAHYEENGQTKHTGLIRHVSSNTFYLFDNYEPHVQETNLLNVNDSSLRITNLKANIISDLITVKSYNILDYINLVFSSTNSSFDTGNSSSSYANSAFEKSNTANTLAHYIFDVANNTNNLLNDVSSYANSAFAVSNNSLNVTTGGTITGNLLVSGNIIPTTNNVYFLGSETNRWHSLYVGPGSVNIDGIVLSNSSGTLQISGAQTILLEGLPDFSEISNTTNNISLIAQSAFDEANSKSQFTLGSFPPINPRSGDRWFDSDIGQEFVYIDDGDSEQWIELSAFVDQNHVSGISYYKLETDYTGQNSTNSQSIFGTGINLIGNTVYEFESIILLSKNSGSNSHNISLSFDGDLEINNILYTVFYSNTSVGLSSVPKLIMINTMSETQIADNFNSNTHNIVIKGTISVNSSGSFIPKYKLSDIPGESFVTEKGSFFKIKIVDGTNAITNINIGSWT